MFLLSSPGLPILLYHLLTENVRSLHCLLLFSSLSMMKRYNDYFYRKTYQSDNHQYWSDSSLPWNHSHTRRHMHWPGWYTWHCSSRRRSRSIHRCPTGNHRQRSREDRHSRTRAWCPHKSLHPHRDSTHTRWWLAIDKGYVLVYHFPTNLHGINVFYHHLFKQSFVQTTYQSNKNKCCVFY